MKRQTEVCKYRHGPLQHGLFQHRWRLPTLALTVLLALLVSCRRQAINTDEVVSVDGDEIRYSEFESYLGENVDSADLPLESSVLEKLFDQFLDERLLVRLALDHGLTSTGNMDQQGMDQQEALAYLLRQTPPRPPSEAEIAAHYDTHREEYLRPASVRLKQILVHEREAAEAVMKALDGGEDFAQVAARFSQVPATTLGDANGRLTRDDLPEAFAESIFEIEPGQVSEIFDADYGFHIFQVLERFPADDQPLGDAADGIRRILQRRILDEQVVSFIDQARGRYTVRIHPSNLPFDYRGFYAQ